uniref:SH3 domain protein n=1 Tax=Candidatus Kentrum sp. TUN TaxID=2126343 RepID=A0A450Z9S0_9GAMM|nr:MAG: SH3 domain protein [Candidatus Kentron sp. TUN]VFK51782.1 MAG: SH3 domain protein [Candidatus Kentron sp. TUN]VFK58320.1 MAG: SH3 domain protein [Candidatus Kentron sp. TUN]
MVIKNLPENTSITFSISGIKRWIIAGLLACLPGIVVAETAYITDRLLAGVHEDKAQDSTVLEVLPTSAALDIISRDGDFTRVRTANGITGWVDTNYLISEKPAQLLLMDLETAQEQLKIQLAEAKAQLQEQRAIASNNGFLPVFNTWFGFDIPLLPTVHQKWGLLLILGFLLAFILGGYVTDSIISRRYYLIERHKKQNGNKASKNKNARKDQGKENETRQHPKIETEKVQA